MYTSTQSESNASALTGAAKDCSRARRALLIQSAGGAGTSASVRGLKPTLVGERGPSTPLQCERGLLTSVMVGSGRSAVDQTQEPRIGTALSGLAGAGFFRSR